MSSVVLGGTGVEGGAGTAPGYDYYDGDNISGNHTSDADDGYPGYEDYPGSFYSQDYSSPYNQTADGYMTAAEYEAGRHLPESIRVIQMQDDGTQSHRRKVDVR